jgi:hypothetical protein
VIGIDIGKNSFHVVGHDARGAIVLRQKWSRGQVDARLANLQNNLSSQLGDVFRGPAAGTTSAPDLASLVARHSGLVVARRLPTISSKGGPATKALVYPFGLGDHVPAIRLFININN